MIYGTSDFNDRVDFEYARINDHTVDRDRLDIHVRQLIVDTEMIPLCIISCYNVKTSVRQISEYQVDAITGKPTGFKTRYKVSDGPFFEFIGLTNLYILQAPYEIEQKLIGSCSWEVEAEKYSIKRL